MRFDKAHEARELDGVDCGVGAGAVEGEDCRFDGIVVVVVVGEWRWGGGGEVCGGLVVGHFFNLCYLMIWLVSLMGVVCSSHAITACWVGDFDGALSDLFSRASLFPWNRSLQI